MIRLSTVNDWRSFYASATEAGWRVPQVERRLFRNLWKEHVRTLDLDGCFCGLVTAVPHEKSGWIGNLIVPQELRGRGYGGRLFAAALENLEERDIDSIWLTASELGQPIYEKAGFTAVDRIERWLLPAAEQSPGENRCASQVSLLQADREVWGEKRSPLLLQLLKNGRVFRCGESIALLQVATDLQIIGPWYGQDEQTNQQLLQKIITSASPDRELVIDLITSSALQKTLVGAGFVCIDSNQLMVRGDVHADLGRMGSLASLGSVG